MHTVAPEHMSTAYFINAPPQSFCMYMYTAIVTRQRLGETVTAATDTHATIELLESSFSMWSMS
jgi:hypothetical protein